jgi:ABC-type Fe3+/spermidine/putrescine transport system ATPase subunit
MNVFENVAFGLQVRRVSRDEIHRRVSAALASVALTGRDHEPVTALSGGEQQRVAVARALVIEPTLLLFDEPLSNLDASLRQQTREEIRSIQRRTSITTLYVTHDQAEALSLSDRLAIMHEGCVEQVGTPAEVYQHPATPFVAQFLGWENVFLGSLSPEGMVVGSSVLEIPDSARPSRSGPMTVALPPDALSLAQEGHPQSFSATVSDVEYQGGSVRLTARHQGCTFKVSLVRIGGGISVGHTVQLSIDWARALFYPVERN